MSSKKNPGAKAGRKKLKLTKQTLKDLTPPAAKAAAVRAGLQKVSDRYSCGCDYSWQH